MWEYICMHVLVFLKTFLDLCREPFPDLNELDSQEVETGLNSSFFHVMVCCENPNRCLKCVPATLRLCHISSFLIWLCCLRKKKRKEKKKAWHSCACISDCPTMVAMPQCLVHVYILHHWPAVSVLIPSLTVRLKIACTLNL